MQARIAHAREKRAVGIEQPVEPVDQHADRQQIEQRPVAPGFAARRRLGLRQPVRAVRSVASGSFPARPGSIAALGRFGCRRRCSGGAVFVVEPRRQLPGELVEGAVFDRRQRRRFRLAEGPERQDVLGFRAFPRVFPNRLAVKSRQQSASGDSAAGSPVSRCRRIRGESSQIGRTVRPKRCGAGGSLNNSKRRNAASRVRPSRSRQTPKPR